MGNEQSKPVFDVVIIQTSASGNLRTREIIAGLGIVDRVCILRNFSVSEIFEKLSTSRKQLFVTGTIRGSENKAVELANLLKQRFPNLICVGYASETLPNPPFSECFVKDLSDLGRSAEDRFLQYIVDFLKDIDG